MFDNQGNDITRDEYANGYTLFVYDITPDPCLSDYKQPTYENRKCIYRISIGTIGGSYKYRSAWGISKSVIPKTKCELARNFKHSDKHDSIRSSRPEFECIFPRSETILCESLLSEVRHS